MKIFYSPSTRGFYHEAIHGERFKLVPDITWQGSDETQRPMELVPNLECKIPGDVVEITKEYHIQLMDAQSAGSEIRPGIDGKPIAIAPPAPTLDELKAAKLKELNDYCQSLANSLTAGYPDFEKLTWEDQRRECKAWQADNTSPTPYIDTLAVQRGIDRVDYLNRTIAKVDAFTNAAQKLVGQRQRYEDQIKIATAQQLTTMTFNIDLS